MTPSEPDRKPCPKAAELVSCEECVDFLLDYVDGRLPAEQQFRFESHFAHCPECETYVDNYRQAAELAQRTGGELRQERDAPIPKPLVDAILKARKHRR